jgi:hypothetical protein
MNSIFWEIQPTNKGKELSWWHFQFRKISPASGFEMKLGLTVQLTDAVSAVLTICKTIDPLYRTVLKNRNGFLFPDFNLHVSSKKYDVVTEKYFAGGSSRERVFNYKVAVSVNSPSLEIIKLFQKSYNELGPKPLKESLIIA